ncbi:MAG: hypothetical protein ACW99A_09980 [Candidatus Kariarchaeaceae archaeon]|jgi:predicted transcriptional regulator
MPKQSVISFEDFFQQELSCEVLVQSLYDLNHLEFDLYCSLLLLEEMGEKADVTTLMEKAERKDRTMVNRSLSSLLQKNLCRREKTSKLGQRGYWYIYKPTPLTELKSRLLDKLNDWHKHAIDEISHIEANFDKKLAKEIQKN